MFPHRLHLPGLFWWWIIGIQHKLVPAKFQSPWLKKLKSPAQLCLEAHLHLRYYQKRVLSSCPGSPLGKTLPKWVGNTTPLPTVAHSWPSMSLATLLPINSSKDLGTPPPCRPARSTCPHWALRWPVSRSASWLSGPWDFCPHGPLPP